MKKMLFVIACLLFSSMSVASHSWGGYHWERSSNPFTKGLGDNVTSQWKSALLLSSQDWSVSSVLDSPIVNGKVKNTRRCSAKTGKIEVCTANYGDNGWLGLASIRISGSHITSGTIQLNDYYYNMPFYNTSAWRNSVMCQEIGHIWGLGHNDDNPYNAPTGTCMDYSTDPTTNQRPNNHDYEMLESIYSHVDVVEDDGGAKPCNPKSPKCNSGAGLNMSERSNWGRLVSETGFVDVYEHDLGHGNKIITFVTRIL